MQEDLERKLEQERREFKNREKEIELESYKKAKQEFELETKKIELDRRQKEIEEQRKKEKEWNNKIKKDEDLKKKRLSVGSDINPLSINPTPKKKPIETKIEKPQAQIKKTPNSIFKFVIL